MIMRCKPKFLFIWVYLNMIYFNPSNEVGYIVWQHLEKTLKLTGIKNISARVF